MTISVLIPTYRRPQDLCRCLKALEAQTTPADEIILVVRDSDEETQAFLAGTLPLPIRQVIVSVSGVVAAMNAGLAEAGGDIVALLDDDAVPWPDWLARIETHFAASPNVGGVGGRDWVRKGLEIDRGSAKVVGKIQWFGRHIGNHHRGVGQPREVDMLKGVNCAYRIVPLRQIGFDPLLWGNGAQVHWELSLGFAYREAGWKLIYDPEIQVDHFEAQRFDEDQRVALFFQADAQRNAVHNETLIMLRYFPNMRRLAFLLWAVVIGVGVEPGILQLLRLLVRGDRHALPRWKATISGRVAGVMSFIHWERCR